MAGPGGQQANKHAKSQKPNDSKSQGGALVKTNAHASVTRHAGSAGASHHPSAGSFRQTVNHSSMGVDNIPRKGMPPGMPWCAPPCWPMCGPPSFCYPNPCMPRPCCPIPCNPWCPPVSSVCCPPCFPMPVPCCPPPMPCCPPIQKCCCSGGKRIVSIPRGSCQPMSRVCQPGDCSSDKPACYNNCNFYVCEPADTFKDKEQPGAETKEVRFVNVAAGDDSIFPAPKGGLRDLYSDPRKSSISSQTNPLHIRVAPDTYLATGPDEDVITSVSPASSNLVEYDHPPSSPRVSVTPRRSSLAPSPPRNSITPPITPISDSRRESATSTTDEEPPSPVESNFNEFSEVPNPPDTEVKVVHKESFRKPSIELPFTAKAKSFETKSSIDLEKKRVSSKPTVANKNKVSTSSKPSVVSLVSTDLTSHLTDEEPEPKPTRVSEKKRVTKLSVVNPEVLEVKRKSSEVSVEKKRKVSPAPKAGSDPETTTKKRHKRKKSKKKKKKKRRSKSAPALCCYQPNREMDYGGCFEQPVNTIFQRDCSTVRPWNDPCDYSCCEVDPCGGHNTRNASKVNSPCGLCYKKYDVCTATFGGTRWPPKSNRQAYAGVSEDSRPDSPGTVFRKRRPKSRERSRSAPRVPTRWPRGLPMPSPSDLSSERASTRPAASINSDDSVTHVMKPARPFRIQQLYDLNMNTSSTSKQILNAKPTRSLLNVSEPDFIPGCALPCSSKSLSTIDLTPSPTSKWNSNERYGSQKLVYVMTMRYDPSELNEQCWRSGKSIPPQRKMNLVNLNPPKVEPSKAKPYAPHALSKFRRTKSAVKNLPKRTNKSKLVINNRGSESASSRNPKVGEAHKSTTELGCEQKSENFNSLQNGPSTSAAKIASESASPRNLTPQAIHSSRNELSGDEMSKTCIKLQHCAECCDMCTGPSPASSTLKGIHQETECDFEFSPDPNSQTDSQSPRRAQTTFDCFDETQGDREEAFEIFDETGLPSQQTGSVTGTKPVEKVESLKTVQLSLKPGTQGFLVQDDADTLDRQEVNPRPTLVSVHPHSQDRDVAALQLKTGDIENVLAVSTEPGNKPFLVSNLESISVTTASLVLPEPKQRGNFQSRIPQRVQTKPPSSASSGSSNGRPYSPGEVLLVTGSTTDHELDVPDSTVILYPPKPTPTPKPRRCPPTNLSPYTVPVLPSLKDLSCLTGTNAYRPPQDRQGTYQHCTDHPTQSYQAEQVCQPCTDSTNFGSGKNAGRPFGFHAESSYETPCQTPNVLPASPRSCAAALNPLLIQGHRALPQPKAISAQSICVLPKLTSPRGIVLPSIRHNQYANPRPGETLPPVKSQAGHCTSPRQLDSCPSRLGRGRL